MKRKLGYVTLFVLIALSFSSCEKLFQNCKNCKQVTYVSGNLTQSGTEAEYCGADLVKVQAIPDATVGNTTVKWECN